MTDLHTNSPPAHVVLRNGDILPKILECLNPRVGMVRDELKERRRTLSRLARVFKLFKYPALVVLWHSQDSLGPFLAFAPEMFHPICHDQVYSNRPSFSKRIPMGQIRQLKIQSDRGSAIISTLLSGWHITVLLQATVE